jgi:thioredoxin 1
MVIQTVTAEEVEATVLRSPGPVVLDFYQASCPPGRVLEPRLERVAEQYAGRVPVYRVDIDRDMAVAERWSALTGSSPRPTFEQHSSARYTPLTFHLLEGVRSG